MNIGKWIQLDANPEETAHAEWHDNKQYKGEFYKEFQPTGVYWLQFL